MKLIPVMVSILFASAMLGYGLASAQSAAMGGGTPTTASHPYTQICGDHPCKPGEVYVPGVTATANATAKTNATSSPTQAKVSMSANVTATKTGANMTKGTMANATGAPLTTGMNMSANVTATKTGANMTGKTTAKAIEPPQKQVSAGVAPSDVKCLTGYQLALNKFDKRPACVTEAVYAKLVARGWAS
ncbi:MAG: hypothetical protein KGI25_04105 [Thaumarchaeota archaeon]|nr:hypothetical protein [Nitrososphaerota archaeon]